VESPDTTLLAGGDGKIVDRSADTSSCGRASGTQPRNRQHRALEYYFGQTTKSFNLGNSALLVAKRNPYRTQLIFSGFLSSATQSTYIDPQILSWPTHGPLVTEEWWAVFDGCPGVRLANNPTDALANIFSLNIPVSGGGAALSPLSATLQVAEYLYSD